MTFGSRQQHEDGGRCRAGQVDEQPDAVIATRASQQMRAGLPRRRIGEIGRMDEQRGGHRA